MLTPEQKARQLIDQQLEEAGWLIQDAAKVNMSAGLGVAVREFQTSTGPADYALFVDRKLVGVIEAKAEGSLLGVVAEQTARYLTSTTKFVQRAADQLPFGYEANGDEVRFCDWRDPQPRSRNVFSFHQPKTLQGWLADGDDTLRHRLQSLPALATHGLRDCQVEAIRNLEESFKHDRPRALIQMATGSGKTFTAVSFVYRLIKFAGAKRILFLVDRGNLGRQTLTEFQQYVTPDDGRKFTDLYNVQNLTSNSLSSVSKVTITTIQRLYSMLRGEAEFEAGNEEESGFEAEAALTAVRPKEVAYNAALPPETYDFVVIDECHRSIYNVWQQVLEYFDAHLIGLTATPAKQTFGFFNRNLVMEYTHERAVVDGVNVGSDIYLIGTRISQQGSVVEKGLPVQHVERLTRKKRWEALDDDLPYAATQLDRSVTAPDQVRTVIREFRDVLFTQLFPGRHIVPKTLIFAKTDAHADLIVDIVREEFGKGNEFCKKITYGTTGEKADDLIKRFRNSFEPRVAVTVDMISTGTDIRPLECLLFLRDVRSRVYFDQMKGRGTRVISTSDLQIVTEDAPAKTRFVLVDAVGVTHSDKKDPATSERIKGLSFKDLLKAVSLGSTEPDHLKALATRLARLHQQLSPAEQTIIGTHAAGATVQDLAGRLYDAVDPVKVEDAAIELAAAAGEPTFTLGPEGEEIPTEPAEAYFRQAEHQLTLAAVAPFDNPELRAVLEKLHAQKDLIIDHLSVDEVRTSEFGERFSPAQAAENLARQQVDKFRAFIKEHHTEILALEVLHNQPWRRRELTHRQLRDLADALKLESPDLTPAHLWDAYERLDKARVRSSAAPTGSKSLLTNLINLVQFALERTDVLEPYALTVEQRYRQWLHQQQLAGRLFSEPQQQWLNMMKDHITTSLTVEAEDFDYAPFGDHGGFGRARVLFGDELLPVVKELNDVLAA
ncbi:DEAD/DEAH box helicase family protein [Hymenobacter sp. BT175]|uniref:type I restriction endonuclease subunit R n=1 Tax=Hymenobacter translucens TaxID=2886507 RepID=UPI001D0EECF4|nr:DEAD/DEAH box helicase family protein [Hymenobacter translucens]MCC2547432.1 DEAD/DEAH box helicase family protein [Hymenobacter translucens]